MLQPCAAVASNWGVRSTLEEIRVLDLLAITPGEYLAADDSTVAQVLDGVDEKLATMKSPDFRCGVPVAGRGHAGEGDSYRPHGDADGGAGRDHASDGCDVVSVGAQLPVVTPKVEATRLLLSKLADAAVPG